MQELLLKQADLKLQLASVSRSVVELSAVGSKSIAVNNLMDNIAIAGTWENSDEKSSSPSICPRAQSINPSFFCNASSPGPAKTFTAPMLAEFDARAFAAIEKKKSVSILFHAYGF